jgi:glutaconate CoA-transferase subunit A
MKTTDAVVKLPFGAHPTSCYPFYTFDPLHIQEYLISDFSDYEKKFIINKTPVQYLENSGGIQTIFNILL